MAGTRHNGRPPVACEVTATHVIAGRTNSAHDALELVDTRSLGDTTLTPGLIADNIHDAGALQQAIRETLAAVGARSGREVILVVPDAAVRIVLLDFDTLPDRKSEADAIVRFRLKKSLPFDVDKASLSYDIQRSVGSVRVVAAVTLSTVLAEYENVVKEAGYIPGVVLPSTVAALGAVDGSRPTMVLKVDRGTTSVAMVDKNELLLFRTLESGSLETNGERLAEDVYPSIVFFQDTYGVSVERLLVAGSTPTAQIAPALESQTGMRVQELVSTVMLPASATGTGRSQLAGVVGALLG